MPDKNERWVSIYEMVIHPANIRGRPPAPMITADFLSLQAAVKAATEKDEPIKDDEDSRGRYLFLQDMVVSSRTDAVAYLWTLGNKAASRPVFHRLQGNVLRTADMFEGESVAVSAHMVIDMRDAKNTMRYLVGLEDIEGVSRMRVEDLLQREMRKIMLVAADVGGREKQGPPTVVLDSLPGPLMGESGARPYEIDIIKLTPRRDVTATHAPFYEETKEERVYKATRDAPLNELIATLPNFVNQLRERHPGHQVRVRWKRPEETRIRTTVINPSQRAEDLLARAMTSSEALTDLGFEMPDATPKINVKLINRMLAALRNPSDKGGK